MIRTEMDSMPTELDVISRKIIQHEIEEAALKKESDKLSQEHLAEIQRELSDMREEFKAKKAQWDNEKGHRQGPAAAGRPGKRQRRAGEGPAGVRPGAGRPAPVRPHPRAEKGPGGGGADCRRGQGRIPCCGTRSRRRRSPRSSSAGQASPWPSSWKGSAKSSSTWKTSSTSGWWVRTRRSAW